MLAFSPLAGPECRWALARKWVFVLRCFVAVMILCVALVASWACWMYHLLDPSFMPGNVLRIALETAVGMSLVFVLLLSPAVLAGAFTGDPSNNTLGLLLSTRVSSAEIVFSRYVSRLGQVGVVLAAGLPGIFFLAGYCGIGIQSSVTLLLLIVAVACGGAGIALAFSIMFTRARDALIGAYVVVLLLVFLPVLVSFWTPAAIAPWLRAINPFWGLGPLVEFNNPETVLKSILLWATMAPTGMLATSWLLRRAYLRRAGGENRTGSRRREVPPLGDCPIRWKELYIESDKDFGLLVRIISRLVLLLLLGGSLLLLGLFFWSRGSGPTPELVKEILWAASVGIKSMAMPMGWLVQCAVGIRAAAGIASEKERGTWDALMMTPLAGRQIVRAKMIESFYSLRWFLIAATIVWSLGVALESLGVGEAAMLAVHMLVYTGFISTVGVLCSLSASTSGRAITITLAAWLVGKIVFTVAAFLLVLAVMLMHYLLWAAAGLASGRSAGFGPQPLMSFEAGMTLFHLALCVSVAASIAWYCHAQFDRLAGRCPERAIPVKVRLT